MSLEKYNKLKSLLQSMKKVLVAFSGGVDSTFLLYTAKEALTEDCVIAVTADSETFSSSEFKFTQKLAKQINVKHLTVKTNEFSIAEFVNNSSERCYYCKKGLFTKFKSMAKEYHFNEVVEGSNVDDLKDYRPGMKALLELEIKSPLREAGFTKPEIRALSKEFNLPTWDKPSFACLASRIPYGEKITVERLKRVEKAETFIRDLGIKQLRVRDHGLIARIEVEPDVMNFFINDSNGKKVVEEFKKIGYKYVALDLEGYRTGAMNEVLEIASLKTDS